jgi:tRNA (adenine37-N6)-methyltransferase
MMITDQETKMVCVGSVEKQSESRYIRVEPKYRTALSGLSQFSHCIVVWWAGRYEEYRFQTENVMDLPYAPGERAGLFATRSPVRPNPICINTCKIIHVDVETGTIEVDEIDAFNGTQVLDIKPYYGCIDRVQEYSQPEWVPDDWGLWYTPIPEIDYAAE